VTLVLLVRGVELTIVLLLGFIERRSWHAAEHSGWEYKTTYNNEIYSSSIRQTRQQEMQKCSEWAEIP